MFIYFLMRKQMRNRLMTKPGPFSNTFVHANKCSLLQASCAFRKRLQDFLLRILHGQCMYPSAVSWMPGPKFQKSCPSVSLNTYQYQRSMVKRSIVSTQICRSATSGRSPFCGGSSCASSLVAHATGLVVDRCGFRANHPDRPKTWPS